MIVVDALHPGDFSKNVTFRYQKGTARSTAKNKYIIYNNDQNYMFGFKLLRYIYRGIKYSLAILFG